MGTGACPAEGSSGAELKERGGGVVSCSSHRFTSSSAAGLHLSSSADRRVSSLFCDRDSRVSLVRFRNLRDLSFFISLHDYGYNVELGPRDAQVLLTAAVTQWGNFTQNMVSHIIAKYICSRMFIIAYY